MKTEDYQFPISQCDVPPERRAALDSFRAKRSTWVSWLDKDEHHAIWDAISAMVWADVSFRALTQFAIDDETSCLRNSLVAEQLINGHAATQVLAIRRLVDKRTDVISLRRLIKELRRNFDSFTRENYVCHDGLPYDYEAVQMKEMVARAGKLAGIDPANRSREDRLPIALLNTIEGWLNDSGADDLAEWSHAYLAHAGDPVNRQRITALMMTTNMMTQAIKTLARVSEAISAYILFAGGRMSSLMPTAQFDQFENLEKPILRADAKDNAYQLWEKLSDERDQFLDGVDVELIDAVKPGAAGT